MIIKLSKPLKVTSDKQISELDLNFESITGEDILALERDSGLKNNALAELMQSPSAQIKFAAHACKLPVNLLSSLPIPDFLKVELAVQDFFGESVLAARDAMDKSEDLPKKSVVQ